MSLLLTLEQGPRSQVVRQTRLDKGELVIGRSPQADWQIDDPDMFVSRAHCRVTAEQDGYFVTDMSSSGLFIDDSGSPLGTGNSIRLKSGMRLRLGDYVLSVDVSPASKARLEPTPRADETPPAPQAPLQSSSHPGSRPPLSLDNDDFFLARNEEQPRPPRPADLPDPFEQPRSGAFQAFENSGGPRNSQAFDDPFSLDPVATPSQEEDAVDSREERSGRDPFGFDDDAASQTSSTAGQQPQPFDDGFDLDPAATPDRHGDAARHGKQGKAADASSPAPWDLPAAEQPSQPMSPAAQNLNAPRQPAAGPADAGLRGAFLRGLGMDEADLPGRDPVAEMEKFGREYRMMMEGLMQLLRKRAEEKGNARIEQTVVGASEVNPLKFLPTVEDALVTIFAERSAGFLAGEPAIADAIRDLAQHHVRAWRGVQGALRRMIDRFDPAALEEELKSSSAIETLLSGGRGAKLWELYQKRHREIAASAEERFLGEIGADFRDAYEEE